MNVKNLYSWAKTPGAALRIQQALREKVTVTGSLRNIKYIAGADAAYQKRAQQTFITAGVVVFDYRTLTRVEESIVRQRVHFPYVPGLLTFREGPGLLAAFQKLRTRPDLIIFDGQGIAHPRGLGIASHLGIILDIPTIGCAKNRLTGEYTPPGPRRGDYSLLSIKGLVCGFVLRTRDRVKPLFISPGYKIGLNSVRNIILQCTKQVRLPEPIRWAHHLVKNYQENV